MEHILGKVKEPLQHFKDKKYFEEFYKKNVIITKKAIKESVNEDNLIIQAIANVNELDKVTNLLSKRLREWYSLYDPELVERVHSHEKLIELILENEKKEKDSMGADLPKVDYDEIILLATQIQGLYGLRKKHETYLESVMKP